jgi:CRISPR-associated endonuclease/helicase Cas3
VYNSKNVIQTGETVSQTFRARVIRDEKGERSQSLETHLIETAELAGKFADAFSSREWGYIAGLWHDLGKYQLDFQRKLNGEKVGVEHSGIGAAIASEMLKDGGIAIAFIIAGHHGGLANFIKSENYQPTPLKERLKRNESGVKDIKALALIPPFIIQPEIPALPVFLSPMQPNTDVATRAVMKRGGEMWIRFLFSALVDADRLNSEAFTEPEKATLRSRFSDVPELEKRIEKYINNKIEAISAEIRCSSVNKLRNMVLEACRTRATEPPGFFSLVVPTGGGKTLSAMSFALKHAVKNQLRRVIVVIPYTSIIEQNAREYRMALGDENVIEHHSSFDYDDQCDSGDVNGYATRAELAVENWDAPVIITTSVQFLETLFSSKASRCRKLHNIARSVIIFDEVQALPPGMLIPIIEAMKELTTNYGCSVLMATATLPALNERQSLPQGLKNVRSIVEDTETLFTGLKRVNYSWPESDKIVEWGDLALDISENNQALVIVHRRQDARILAEELTKYCELDTIFHLSALMCPAHRLEVINEVKQRLNEGMTTRLVSTQLIEAGVDLDFPVVYRALGGLDSIVQAAGRCNREGRYSRGEVILFRAPSKPPPGTPRKAKDITETMLKGRPELEPDSFEIMNEYFKRLYMTHDLDIKNIQREREEYNFATVGQSFRLIEDGFTESIVVPYGDAVNRLEKIRYEGLNKELLRTLQPFIVNVYPTAFKQMSESGYLLEVHPSLYTIRPDVENLYDSKKFGLTAGDETSSMSALIV